MVQTRLKEQENKQQHLNISSAPLTLNDGDHKNAAHNQGFIYSGILLEIRRL